MIKVLLVDDQQILAEGIKSVLQTSSELSVVGIASDGLRAVDACMQLKPDVVLMDIRMPVMSGYEASVAIRSSSHPDKNIPIIAMTADAFSDDIQHCLDCGMNEHVAKPIDVNRLTQLLKKYLKN